MSLLTDYPCRYSCDSKDDGVSEFCITVLERCSPYDRKAAFFLLGPRPVRTGSTMRLPCGAM